MTIAHYIRMPETERARAVEVEAAVELEYARSVENLSAAEQALRESEKGRHKGI
jgi:hypothetical protein